MFFDARRYDLAKVGRYKFNKKLMFRNRIAGHRLAQDVLDPSTGEILFEAGVRLTKEQADAIQNAAVPYVYVETEEKEVKVLSSMMVDITSFVDVDPEEVGVTELVYYPALEKILENMMIRLKSMQVQCIEQTYFERKKPLQICQKLYISRSAYYRYLNKGIEELTKLYNQNIVSDVEIENEEK